MKTHTSSPYRAAVAFALVAIVAGLLAACDPPPVGMFASIEREQRIGKNNLEKDSYPRSMVRFSGTYIVSLGPSISIRDASSPADESDTPEWRDLGLPEGYDTVLGVFVAGETARAVVTSQADTASGIFEISVDESKLEFSESADNELPDSLQNERLQYAVQLDGRIFVGYGSPSSGYGLHNATDDVSLFTEGALALDAVRTSDSYHFLLSDGRIYSYTEADAGDGTIAGADDAFGVTGIEEAVGRLVGMTYSDTLGGLVLTGETDGGDFVILDITGGSIAPTNEDGNPVVEGESLYTDVFYLDFAERLLVGLQGDGFLEVPFDGDTLDFGSDGLPDQPTGDVYVTSELSEATVTGFYVDTTADPDLVFALTAGDGLWRGYLENDVLTWSWE